MARDLCVSCQQLTTALQAADAELGEIRSGSLGDKLVGAPVVTATAIDWMTILLAAAMAFMKALQESKVMPAPTPEAGK